jgi:hypothetical protein
MVTTEDSCALDHFCLRSQSDPAWSHTEHHANDTDNPDRTVVICAVVPEYYGKDYPAEVTDGAN